MQTLQILIFEWFGCLCSSSCRQYCQEPTPSSHRTYSCIFACCQARCCRLHARHLLTTYFCCSYVLILVSKSTPPHPPPPSNYDWQLCARSYRVTKWPNMCLLRLPDTLRLYLHIHAVWRLCDLLHAPHPEPPQRRVRPLHISEQSRSRLRSIIQKMHQMSCVYCVVLTVVWHCSKHIRRAVRSDYSVWKQTLLQPMVAAGNSRQNDEV